MMTAEKLLREVAEETDYPCTLLWECDGPGSTAITKHGMFSVNRHLFYFQEFRGGNGFEIFIVADEKNSIHNCRCVIKKRILS